MAGLKITDPSILQENVSRENIIPTASPGSQIPETITVGNLIGFLEKSLQEDMQTAKQLLGIDALEKSNSSAAFDENITYQPNQFVYRSDNSGKWLYRFVNSHRGPWNPGDVVKTDLYSEIMSIRGTESETVVVIVRSEVPSFEPSGVEVALRIGDNISTQTTNAEGKALFQVNSGELYTIEVSEAIGYELIMPKSFKAISDTRYVYLDYIPKTGTVSFEKVRGKISKYDAGGANVVPPEFSGKTMTVSIDGGSQQTSAFDSTGWSGYIQVPKGTSYSILWPTISGYTTPPQKTYTASFSERVAFSDPYYYYGNPGVYLVATDGSEHTYDAWMDSGKTKEDLKALRVATEALVEKGQDFYLDIQNITTVSKQWASSNVSFDLAAASGDPTSLTTNAEIAKTNYIGSRLTQIIIQQGDEKNVATPAADWCYYADGTGTLKDRRFIEINGQKYYGFLGSFGQIWQLKQVLDTVNTVLGQIVGKSGISLNSGNWWSSSENSSTNSWYLTYGSPGNNTKTNSFTTLALFALDKS